VVLPLLRLHDLCGGRKALWRDSDTVPEAVELNDRIQIIYVVYILNHSSTAVGSRTHLLPHCG